MQGAWPWVPKLKVNPTLEHGAYQTNKNNGEGETVSGKQRSSALRLLSAAAPPRFLFIIATMPFDDIFGSLPLSTDIT